MVDFGSSQGAKASCSTNSFDQQKGIIAMPFLQKMVRLCSDGWAQGWHERNGGNASYRLTAEEVQASRAFFSAQTDWRPLQAPVLSLAGECFAITRSGGYMRNVADDPENGLGIIELDDQGAAYRVVWGLSQGGKPTSELEAHLNIQAVRAAATQGAARVLYHCHPVSIVALTSAFPPDSVAVSKALWKIMTECITVFPEGVGVVPFAVPGSVELARLTAQDMEQHAATIWAHHGLLASGATFDDAFGLAHVIAKAAEIYEVSCATCGGPEFPQQLSDDDLRAIAAYWKLDVPYLR